jgi:hypothetical protein
MPWANPMGRRANQSGFLKQLGAVGFEVYLSPTPLIDTQLGEEFVNVGDYK